MDVAREKFKPALTHAGYGANGIDIVHSGLRFDLKARDQGLVCGLYVRVDVDAVSDSRERRALPAKPLRWEFRVSDYAHSLLGCIDLRNYDAAGKSISFDVVQARPRSLTGHQRLMLF